MSDGTQAIPLLLPQVGNAMEEGTILAWRVREGDRVVAGDVLYELETDKANMEIEAEIPGRIAKIVVGVGETAPIKAIVAYLGEEDATLPERDSSMRPAPRTPLLPSEARRSPVLGAPPSDALKATRPRVSPAARKAAEALGVDLASVRVGSGPAGRVIRADVEGAATGSAAKTPAASEPLRGRVPMSKMRRAIARAMQISKQTVPHFYMRLTIDAAPLEAAYRREKALFPCSMNDFIILGVGQALMEFPQFRQQADGDYVRQIDTANVGIAVGINDGLVVPVLLGVDRMGLQGVAAASRRLVEQARAGTVEGAGQGVLTISNLGMFGIEEFAAIVNPPESGILAVGALRETVWAYDGALRAGKAMTMTLSVDHRVVDGVLAAKFLARLKELLERPALLGS